MSNTREGFANGYALLIGVEENHYLETVHVLAPLSLCLRQTNPTAFEN